MKDAVIFGFEEMCVEEVEIRAAWGQISIFNLGCCKVIVEGFDSESLKIDLIGDDRTRCVLLKIDIWNIMLCPYNIAD